MLAISMSRTLAACLLGRLSRESGRSPRRVLADDRLLMSRPIVCAFAWAAALAIIGGGGATARAADSPPGEPGPDTPAATTLEAAPVLVAGACDTPAHHQFDFWLGEWQVFDATNDKLVALDRVEKHSEGCIVEQDMTFLTDMYRRPGAGYRLSGMSINRYDGEAWLELWADNQWGAIAMRGGPESEGAMVLRTITPSRHRDLKIVWQARADGTVRILQYVAPAGSGQWKKYGDLLYRRNH